MQKDKINDAEATEQKTTAQEPEAAETKPGTQNTDETSDAAAQSADGEEAAVNEEAETLRKELLEVKDRLLRSLAEYDNFRKRSAKDRENACQYAKSEVLMKILPLVDNFERAAQNERASFEDYKKGIQMIHKQFCDSLQSLGVEAFGEKGETFDPNLHAAVMHIEDASYGENEIVEVFAKGYRLGEKILRPASVRVAN